MRDKMSKNRVNSKNFPPAAIFPKRYLYKGVFLIDFSQKVPIQGVPLISGADLCPTFGGDDSKF